MRKRLITAKRKRPIRLVLAGDHTLLRELIAKLIAENSHLFRLVAQVATVAAAFSVCADAEPDLLVLSMALLVSAGEGVITRAHKEIPKVNILVYAGPMVSTEQILTAIQEGITGCVCKGSSVLEFLTAIDQTRQGRNYFCAECSHLLSEIICGRRTAAGKASGLSPREIEVLQLIADGKTNKQIAQVLGLSVATVDTHRRNLMVKTHAHNAADVIRYGQRSHLLSSDS